MIGEGKDWIDLNLEDITYHSLEAVAALIRGAQEGATELKFKLTHNKQKEVV